MNELFLNAQGFMTLSGDAANGAAATTGEGAATSAATGSPIMLIVWLVVMVAVFYFFLIRPQRKRDKEVKELQSSLQIGDEVVTTGGIVGIVVNIKEDTVVIETGSDRSKVRIKRWAIQSNETVHE